MDHLDVNGIGGIIRKMRKEKGLRLEDLADENISPATISNLERGVPHVRKDKLSYLMEKMGISMHELPVLILEEQKQLRDIRFQLSAIESMKRLDQLDQALEELGKMNISDDHPCAPTVYWLKGVCFLFKKKYKKAERDLFNAIRLSSQNHVAQTDNIEAYSFSDLSLCCYHQNDIQTALQYTESGLAAFNQEGNNQIVKYLLLRNKAIYLERLGRVVEALKVVQEVWNELDQIKQIETLLSFYSLRAELLRKSGSFDEAIYYVQEGIELSSLNYHYKSALDLWVILGSIYTAQNDWIKAEMCFKISMGIPKEKVKYNQIIRAHIQLGTLYIRQEKWIKAKEILSKAIQESEKLNSTAYLTEAVHVMGLCYYFQNLKEEARPHFQKAIHLSKKYQLKEKENRAWYYLAKCWEGIDEEEFKQCTVNMFKVQEELQQQKKEGVYHEVG